MQNFIKHRYSVRKYLSKDISNELLNELFETAFRASNTGNMQTYSVIITRDVKKKQELSPCHFNQTMIMEAPVVLTFCADFRRFSKWCELSNAKPAYNNFLSFFSAATDTLLAAQTFSTAAEYKGLGICYLGTTNYMAQEIIDILELPSLVIPITTITLGYPDEQPGQTDRLPVDGLIHYETYNDNKDIKAMYAYKESLPEMQKFVLENEKESLAQVFTDIRYNKNNNEAFSKRLLEVIKNQGFLF